MSNYPTALDTFRTIENLPQIVYDASNTKTLFAEDLQNLFAMILATQTELGLDPAGASATVEARLDAIEGSIPTDFDTLAINVAPTTQTAQGVRVAMTYGEALTVGQLVYYKSDSKVYKSDATSLATNKIPAIGLALESEASGAHDVLLVGTYRDATKWTGATALTIGGVCYLSATAGGITQTQPASSGNVIQTIGIATGADTIYFNPSLDYLERV
jgi:hypothetical protein